MNKERIFYNWLQDLQNKVVEAKLEWIVPKVYEDEDGDYWGEFLGKRGRVGASTDNDGTMWSWFVGKNDKGEARMEGPEMNNSFEHYRLFLEYNHGQP